MCPAVFISVDSTALLPIVLGLKLNTAEPGILVINHKIITSSMFGYFCLPTKFHTFSPQNLTHYIKSLKWFLQFSCGVVDMLFMDYKILKRFLCYQKPYTLRFTLYGCLLAILISANQHQLYSRTRNEQLILV